MLSLPRSFSHTLAHLHVDVYFLRLCSQFLFLALSLCAPRPCLVFILRHLLCLSQKSPNPPLHYHPTPPSLSLSILSKFTLALSEEQQHNYSSSLKNACTSSFPCTPPLLDTILPVLLRNDCSCPSRAYSFSTRQRNVCMTFMFISCVRVRVCPYAYVSACVRVRACLHTCVRTRTTSRLVLLFDVCAAVSPAASLRICLICPSQGW